MREILFRGKRKDNGEWICGYYALRGIHLGTIEEEIYPTIAPFGNYPISYEVAPKTLGQFTGLIDRNGKKIFEGDIIQHGKRKGTIFYYGNFGMFMISWIPNGGANIFMNVLHTEVDVIGNIHDDPELLKGGVVDG